MSETVPTLCNSSLVGELSRTAAKTPSTMPRQNDSTDGRLVDSRDLGLRESGVHYLQYSADHLPSGVYMAVFDNGERSASIKLMLEK